MGRKHSFINQLEGHFEEYEESGENQKYLSIKHYLKEGWLGSAYQTFLDSNEVIEESDLSEDMKGREKAKVLDARKCGIGHNFRLFPPWDSSSPPEGIQTLPLFWSLYWQHGKRKKNFLII